ncbi:enoyl-CoA hydratase/isomerase family protein [Bordetella ansorpii]|uniref:Enoyl-CoA hydratase/isomerase family protein n=1 Tax=Bordetella ansorpii TaxID=288768 RepID=A0A157LWN6_9BORD|nr:enoyl-CoA hydratase-related protein [Bordetella ansorpii]SAI00819.1 enoyl-CoA hydratase/isomerase family protein [Bordetella ansorpii]
MTEPRQEDPQELVQCRLEDHVAIIRLNRPDRLNALNDAMRDRLAELCRQAGRDPQVRAVMLCAAGRAFCASGDVSTMGHFTVTSARERLQGAHAMIRALADIDKPVVAAVQGAVAGIGWSLALACDTVLAANTAFFSQVFKNVGLAPDGGAIYLLAQNIGLLRAKELVLSGRRLGAQEAFDMGLVTRVVDAGSLEEEALATAATLAHGPTLAYGFGKRLFRQAYAPALETYLDAENWAQSAALMTEDHREGVEAFLEKRAPVFKGR